MDIGDLVHGKYRVLRFIASGAMGSVYEVRHELIGKRMALKCLHPEFVQNTHFVDRFIHEAYAVSALESEHIVSVTDAGMAETGEHFIIMEYLEGEDLEVLITREQTLSPPRALAIVVQICSALIEAHHREIIHRDLKPQSIFILERGSREFVKILDFGTAKFRSAIDGLPLKMTQSGVSLGTPHYMAPEQMGEAGDVDERADIYSLGVIFYRLLTGRHPFEAASYSELIAITLSDPPTPPTVYCPDLDAKYEDVLLRMIAADRAVRYQSMTAVMAALEILSALSHPHTPKAVFHDTIPTIPPISAPLLETETTMQTSTGKTRRVPKSLLLVVASVSILLFLGVVGGFIAASLAHRGRSPSRVDGGQQEREQGQGTVVEREKRDCHGGDVKQCVSLGWRHYWGDGIDFDDARAVTYFRQGCAAGFASACTGLGLAHNYAFGVELDINEATSLYRRACDEGDARGCHELGILYENGRGMQVDRKRAGQLFQRGCDGNFGPSCAALGFYFEKGVGVSQDSSRSQQIYRKAFELNSQNCAEAEFAACESLAFMYQNGRGIAKDYALAHAISRRYCKSAPSTHCIRLAGQYRFGRGVAASYEKAFEIYDRVCQLRPSRGCYSLGLLYRDGHGVAQDLGQAAQLFRISCDSGDGLGCFRLGWFHENGKGVEKNLAQAATYYRKACDLGTVAGCTNLGVFFSHGLGQIEDDVRAVELYKRGCDGGLARSCTNVGIMYRDGNGVAKSSNIAVRYFRLGCEGDHGQGCFQLAFQYHHGDGVEKNQPEALRLFKRACNLKHEKACTKLRKM